jgi:hypothetical protein
MTLIFLDIDGTCADSSKRFLRAGHEPKTRGPAYTKWLNKVQDRRSLLKDLPVRGMPELAMMMRDNLIYLTARSEIYREVTKQWLTENMFPEAQLLMRPKRNTEQAGELKERIILSIVDPEDDVIVIDDDYNEELEVVCKRNHWTLLKARSGS